MVVIGVICSDDQVKDKAKDLLSPILGPVKKAPGSWPFKGTDYYQREMGENLRRSFLYTEKQVNRDMLADIKLFTNSVED